MNLSKIRETELKKLALVRLLKEGLSPELETVCAEILDLYNAASGSIIDNAEIKDELKYSQFNLTKEMATADIRSAYTALETLILEIRTKALNSEALIESLNLKLKKLEKHVKDLLFSLDLSDGEIDVFTETFNSLENIDSDNTTANVNTKAGIVYGAFFSAGHTNVDAHEAIDSIDFDIVSNGYTGLTVYPEYGIDKLYDSLSDTQWKLDVKSSKAEPQELLIYIDLKEATTISRIALLRDRGDIYAALFYTDSSGRVNEITSYQKFEGDIVFNFPLLEAKYFIIKLKSTSSSFQSGVYTHSFNGREIEISLGGHTGLSSLLSVETAVNPFSRISLDADEFIDDDCSIDYYLRWTVDNSTWSDFVNIVPKNRIPIDIDRYLTVFSSASPVSHACLVDYTYVHPYNSGSNIFLNYPHVGMPDYDFTRTKIIRSMDSTKQLGNNLYQCYFYLSAAETIDFSLLPGYVDGAHLAEAALLSAGIHKFISGVEDVSSLFTYFGGFLCDYVPELSFINIAENNNYSLFSMIKDGANYIPIVKEIDGYPDEDFLFISYDAQTASKALKFQYKIDITGFNEKTPSINKLKIKTV